MFVLFDELNVPTKEKRKKNNSVWVAEGRGWLPLATWFRQALSDWMRLKPSMDTTAFLNRMINSSCCTRNAVPLTSVRLQVSFTVLCITITAGHFMHVLPAGLQCAVTLYAFSFWIPRSVVRSSQSQVKHFFLRWTQFFVAPQFKTSLWDVFMQNTTRHETTQHNTTAKSPV